MNEVLKTSSAEKVGSSEVDNFTVQALKHTVVQETDDESVDDS